MKSGDYTSPCEIIDDARRGRCAVLRRFVCACAAATFWFAAASPARGQETLNRPVEETAFELSVSQEFNESSKPAIVVNASIPYRRLVFFLRERRYEARYRVYLELKKRDSALADRYAYLDLRGSEGAKAADAAGLRNMIDWVEGQ